MAGLVCHDHDAVQRILVARERALLERLSALPDRGYSRPAVAKKGWSAITA